MCEEVAGEVIVSFPREDDAGRALVMWVRDHGGRIHHMGSLDDHLADLDLGPTQGSGDMPEFHRFAVPDGEEESQAERLREVYHRLSEGITLMAFAAAADGHPDPIEAARELGDRWYRSADRPLRFHSSPNHILSLTGPGQQSLRPDLTPVHNRNRSIVGFAPRGTRPTAGRVRIAIIDSGIEAGPAMHVVRTADFTASPRPVVGEAIDGFGHGTVVAAIVTDLLPEAELVIYKVADREGHATEFDVIAALARLEDVDIVNMSLAFGLDRPDCATCGRRANSARAVVFEMALDAILARSPAPILVAAAGNWAKPQLAYPARFGKVVAVGSVNSAGAPSSFSNWGELDHDGNPHRLVFFAPGGDRGTTPEDVATTTDQSGAPHGWSGTSFACAYASATIGATLLSGDRESVIDRLTEAAKRGPLPQGHGNGIIQATEPTGHSPEVNRAIRDRFDQLRQ
jgi:hypothetical protein